MYLWLDGKCAKIRNAAKRPHSVLWAYGACEDGERELLGFPIHYSKGIAHWESMLVVRDENSGCEQAILSLFGDVKQQSCAVHLKCNVGKLLGKLNGGEFCSHFSEIFKQSSLRAKVEKSLVFYTVADSALWRTHLKSTNMLEGFFRELKRLEKHRQFRYADNASCQRFYYAYAKIYNDDHPRMADPPKEKAKGQLIASNPTKRPQGLPATRLSTTTGIHSAPQQRGKAADKEVTLTQQ